MRGEDQRQQGVFSYVSLEQRVPAEHPLRPVRKIVDEIFGGMSKQFDELYSATGRPSIAPERLLRALLLQILYSVRSERMLMEQLDYNLLFRWFVGLDMDEPIWSHAVFSKNRDRLLNQELARMFFDRVLRQAQGHLSDDHFTVDGTMIEACASQKSFQKKDGDDDEGGEFRGQKRTNDTHQSKDRPGGQTVSQGQRAGSKAELSGPRVDREPQRNDRGRAVNASGWHSRTRGCDDPRLSATATQR
jgi:transposase